MSKKLLVCTAPEVCVVHYEGVGIVIEPGKVYDADGVEVKAAPWAFVAPVEDATADPGAKRQIRR